MGALKAIQPLKIKELGLQDYEITWAAMKAFTEARHADTQDELWVVEHPPVYTLGRAGKKEHLLRKTAIPLVKTDRGGQVTYHGPGQLVIYLLLDLHRRKLGVRQLVTMIEDSIISLLSHYSITAYSDKKAPGVYVDHKKIAALGLRVSKGRTTHGLSLNINMDTAPFLDINPCGYEHLEITQCSELGIQESQRVIAHQLIMLLSKQIEKPPSPSV